MLFGRAFRKEVHSSGSLAMLSAMRQCDFVVTITVVRSVTHHVMDISLPALARAGRAISGAGRGR
jgi:hypothetical protein